MAYFQSVQSTFASSNESSVQELLQSTLRNLIYTTSAAYLIWHLVATLNWPVQTSWQLWVISLTIFGAAAGSLWLLSLSLTAALTVWNAGLMAAITLAVVLFGRPEAACLFMVLPLMAAVIAGWPAALLVEGMVAVLVWQLTQDSISVPLNLAQSWIIVLGGVFAAKLGIVSGLELITATQWSLYNMRQAQEKMEQARMHRAQMVHLYKELDQAYYQLERANMELAMARETAEEAERFKAEFVANVSHELRTPLNLIVGFTEIMATSPESYDNIHLPGAYRSDLNAVYHSAQHLLTLVDDVLDLARIEAGRIALLREEVDLIELVADTMRIIGQYVEAKGLELRVNVEPNLPSLWIDRLRIRQSLLNLLVNAARYTERGWIAIQVYRQDEEVVVRVIDTGDGIPAQHLPRLFEEFHSNEQPVSNWHAGTGLGLPISKKFIELHHGRMGVDSTHGKGSCFWFTLPCSGMPATEVPHSASHRYRPIVRLGASERIAVVVHRDYRMASLLKRYLDGYQVVGATDLEEGQRLAHELKAIAVITDVMEQPPSVPGSLLTVCCTLPSIHLVAHKLGVEEMLVKPVSRHELLTAVDRLDRPIHRALIVDDDPTVVRLFRRMLRSRIPPQDCLQAYNGREALESMRSKHPDLVILDLIMPEVDGHSVLAQMALDPDLVEIPVILVSARGQDPVNLRLNGPIQIDKKAGFEFGEVMRILESTFNSLTPHWDRSDTKAPMLPTTPAESQVLRDNPQPQASAPSQAH